MQLSARSCCVSSGTVSATGSIFALVPNSSSEFTYITSRQMFRFGSAARVGRSICSEPTYITSS